MTYALKLCLIPIVMAAVLVVLLLGLIMPFPAQAEDRQCLAEAMYYEARNQGWRGMLAVGVVIQNRVDDPRFPSSICAVVKQGRYWNGNPVRNQCQFSYWCDGKKERPEEDVEEQEAWTTAQYLAATLIMSEIKLTGIEDATHYHATYVRPKWATKLERRQQIGGHLFYAQR